MLARVAESLYWIGRDLERSEHCARYLKVQFFSTLDTPMSQNKDFTLRSILFMSGTNFDTDATMREREVWQKVIFDNNNPFSIFKMSQNVRENARSIRNNISTELWESINKWYLYNKNLNANSFGSRDIFSYYEKTNGHIALIKSDVYNTLLHTDAWNFIFLGMHLERAMQILRILRSKISDSIILSNNGMNLAVEHYQWTTLLKSLEAFDVHRTQNKGLLSKASIFELVLANCLFPRSLQFTTKKIMEHFTLISVKPSKHADILQQFEKELKSSTDFNDFSDENKVMTSIEEIQSYLANFHFEVERLYFQ